MALTLDHTKNESSDDGVSDLVCFVSGLLLGTNAKVRTWFGTFIRNGQQVGRPLNILLLLALVVTSLDVSTSICPNANKSSLGAACTRQPLLMDH